MTAYYNEYDKHAAAWLRELIKAGLIADGEVDERSIVDVQPNELRGFTQCHFFAGIGGWSYALRLAGWPDDKSVWTGSCPCQPFSSAGKGLGTADARHLWPEFYRLIRECEPATVFGEQVASKAGLGWLDGVFADLEGSGYTCGAADLCAAGVGAPHIRQRLFWVADASSKPGWNKSKNTSGRSTRKASDEFDEAGSDCWLADAEHNGSHPATATSPKSDCDGANDGVLERSGGRLVNPLNPRLEGHSEHGGNGREPRRINAGTHRPVAASGWDSFELVRCVEPTKEPGRYVEKWRRVESGLVPLAYGVSGRVGLLRGYGNAINPKVAATFIQAVMESINA